MTFLNFEPGTLLQELGIVGITDDRSDEEIEQVSEAWEPILQYRETGAKARFLPERSELVIPYQHRPYPQRD